MAEVSKRTRTAIYLMMLGSFLGSINQTILSPALPSIMADLHIDASAGQWLTTIFLLVNGIMIPCTAYLMARFTTRQLYLAAMTLFAVGTLLCGLAHTFVLLLLARVLQAMGFGVLMPLLSGTVLMVYPPNQRGKAMGMIGLVFSIAPGHRAFDRRLCYRRLRLECRLPRAGSADRYRYHPQRRHHAKHRRNPSH